jgi:hypothetical protein
MTDQFQATAPRRWPDEPPALVRSPEGVPIIAWVSLGSAIAGLVVPIVLAIVAELLMGVSPKIERAIAGCALLFLLLEFVAFACGIAGRRAAAGKIGIFLSCLAFTFVFCAGMAWIAYGVGPTPPARLPRAPADPLVDQ